MVTKVEPVQGEPWPVERSVHAACCLNYGKDQPQLLIHGGLGKGNKVLGDMWILDVDAGKWTKVSLRTISIIVIKYAYMKYDIRTFIYVHMDTSL